MKKVLVLVEGQTEERFIKDVLAQYFYAKNIFIIPKILTSKKVKDGANFKGGLRTYYKVKKNLLKLFEDSQASIITTMFDYYGLPTNFPKIEEVNGDCYNKVKQLEKSFYTDINQKRFLPYLQLHEFETLLFSNPKKVSLAFSGNGLNKIEKIVEEFKNPELINNHVETCPSRRISAIYPNYNKVVFGSLILNRIGINEIKNKCKHFSSWLNNIEEQANR